MKQKDLRKYDPICIMSSGFMFDEIVIDIIRNKKLGLYNEENDCLFIQIEDNIICMCRG